MCPMHAAIEVVHVDVPLHENYANNGTARNNNISSEEERRSNKI